MEYNLTVVYESVHAILESKKAYCLKVVKVLVGKFSHKKKVLPELIYGDYD